MDSELQAQLYGTAVPVCLTSWSRTRSAQSWSYCWMSHFLWWTPTLRRQSPRFPTNIADPEKKDFRFERHAEEWQIYLFERVRSTPKLIGQPGQKWSIVLVRRQLSCVQQFEQRSEEGCVNAGSAQLQAYPCSVARESTQHLKIIFHYGQSNEQFS